MLKITMQSTVAIFAFILTFNNIFLLFDLRNRFLEKLHL